MSLAVLVKDAEMGKTPKVLFGLRREGAGVRRGKAVRDVSLEQNLIMIEVLGVQSTFWIS
jgi:hypothetical protein